MGTVSANALFPADGHDHAACMTAAQLRAQTALQVAGLRMTVLRAKVLEEVSASHAAIGAYDILDRIAGKGRRLAPISVYRALDALVTAGVVHRLESRNAYFTCQQPHDTRRSYLVLICSACGRVAEAPAGRVLEAVEAVVRAVDFTLENAMVEVSGRCKPCAQ